MSNTNTEALALVWESVEQQNRNIQPCAMERARVPGGWLYRASYAPFKGQPAFSIAFVPDEAAR